MLYNKKPLVQSVVEPTDTNVYWVQVIPNSTDVPIIKTFHNGAWIPLTGTPASIQDLLDLKAPLESPAFTGNPTINGIQIPTSDLNGTNYLMVYGTGTPQENAAELQAAYEAAKKMPRFIGFTSPTSPTYMYVGQTFGVYMGGSPTYYKILVDGEYIPYQMSGSAIVTESEAKSVRTTVIVAPGEYNFGASAFVVDAESINIVSLTGNSDVFISSTEKNLSQNYFYGIKVTANNILVKGINCKTNTFYIADNLDNLICEYCIGGDYSFGGWMGNVSGTFNNCKGGDYSFGGYDGNVLGTFNNCIGGNYSFGTNNGTVSGTFNNCIGGNASFGAYGGTISGTLNYCIGSTNSFGLYGTIASSARLYYTRLTSGTFPTPVAGGRLILCIDGSNNVITI